MTIKITDLNTYEITRVKLTDENSCRVMRRAIAMYQSAKKLQIRGIMFSFYLKYSWQLEKGHVWA